MSLWDLRSDTVTRPCAVMRKAMAEAPVGDDVYVEDPTVIELEREGARLLGMEASLFAASGTMGNLLALLSHCQRGEGAVIGMRSHIFKYEAGGMAALGGIMPLPVDDAEGLPPLESFLSLCYDGRDVHQVRTRLLCLENTHNACGGRALSPEEMEPLCQAAREKGVLLHLDGARLFNASVAWGVAPARYGSLVDSVQICLSKGLGAPVGSLLCGPQELIVKARKWRKALGGGMRQAGILAAAGLVALRSRIDRLAEDHEKARRLASILRDSAVDLMDVPNGTNMIYFRLPREGLETAFIEACRSRGVLVGKAGPALIRIVTHLDVPSVAVEEIGKSLVEAVQSL